MSGDITETGRQLLELVSTDPSRALRETRQELDRLAADDHAGRAVLRRVEGIARRELGDLEGARTALSAAVETPTTPATVHSVERRGRAWRS